MPTLIIGTRRFHADRHSVERAAQRMFRMTDAQRRHRLEAAKTQLVRAVDAAPDGVAPGSVRRAAATILAQGISEI
jgi:hypothetical protein